MAAADRGNYPLVNFEAPDGRVRDWFPPLLAVCADKRAYGWEALEQQGKAGWTVVRSLKRSLKDAGPGSVIDVAGQRLNVSLLMTEMMMALRRELLAGKSHLERSLNTTSCRRCLACQRTPRAISDF